MIETLEAVSLDICLTTYPCKHYCIVSVDGQKISKTLSAQRICEYIDTGMYNKETITETKKIAIASHCGGQSYVHSGATTAIDYIDTPKPRIVPVQKPKTIFDYGSTDEKTNIFR